MDYTCTSFDKRCEQSDVQHKAAGKVSFLMMASKVFFHPCCSVKTHPAIN